MTARFSYEYGLEAMQRMARCREDHENGGRVAAPPMSLDDLHRNMIRVTALRVGPAPGREEAGADVAGPRRGLSSSWFASWRTPRLTMG